MTIGPDLLEHLQVLRRQYLQVVGLDQLRWIDEKSLKEPEVQSWVHDNLFNLEKIPSPPPERYQMRVLKLLISRLERAIEDPEEDELSDDLMSRLSSLLSSSLPSETVSAQQKAFVTYTFPSLPTDDAISRDRAVTLLESRAIISSSGTTGLRTWEAALHLGAFLASERGQKMVQHKAVLELGAGTGMLSILCAKHFDVRRIVATDGDEAVVDAINTNIFLNSLDLAEGSSELKIGTAALKWGWYVQEEGFEEDYGIKAPDVLLGADVTYDRTVIPALVSTLRGFFELNPSLEVLLAATIRNEKTFEAFMTACRRNGFRLEMIDFSPVPENEQKGPFYPTTTPIQIWHIVRTEKS